jgi:hypothetical protein
MSQDERAPKYSDLFASNHDHPSDCAYCPICATISVVRSTRPEVLEHVAAAAKELITAFSLMLEEAGQVAAAAEAAARASSAREPAGDEPKIRRIDIG